MSLYRFIASDFDIMSVYKQDISYISSWNEYLRLFPERSLEEVHKHTKAPYAICLEWVYSDKMATILFDIIQEWIIEREKIELWNCWEGDYDVPMIKSIMARDFKKDHLKELWGQKEFDGTKCIIIY